MSASVKGDFKGLEELQTQIAELADRPRLGLAKVMAETAIDLVREGFDEQRDPYGNAWAPLKKQRSRKRRTKLTDKILQDSGQLRNSLTRDKPEVSESGFRIGTNVEHAAFHQGGTSDRSEPATRVQAVNKRGRFMKHSKAAKQKRGAVGFRVLNFQAGGGKTPARPFLPTGELPPAWDKALGKVATEFLERRLQKK